MPVGNGRILLGAMAGVAVGVVVSMAGAWQGGEAGGRLNLPSGQLELARLVDLAAERLGLRIEYNAGDLRGAAVTLRLRDGVADDELWDITNQLLAARGLAAVQMPGSDVLSITKVSSAQVLARLETGDHAVAPGGFVNVLYQLEHRNVKEINEALRPFLSKPGGSVTAVGSTDLVLLSDYKPRIDQAISIIERLDVPSEDAALETIEVRNLAANQLTGLANSAAIAMSSVTGRQLKGKLIPVPDGNAVVLVSPANEVAYWRGLVERFDRREAVETRSYAPRYFAVGEVAHLVEDVARDESPRGSGDRWELVTDELTGTLIVTATPSEHGQVESLIARLDAIPGAARRPVRSFPIRNRPVHDILDVLSRLIEAGVLESGELAATAAPAARQRSERRVLPPGAEPIVPRQVPAQRPQTRSQVGSPAGDAPITLTADEGTNTLIAVGDARLLVQLEQLIRTLDIRQPQVMIEALVVNLSDTQTYDLGVELEAMGVSGNTMFNLASLFGLGAVGVEAAETPAGSGGTALVLSPGDFRILIRALETLNEGRSLTIPKVLVANNQQAVLDSVLQQPFASTNASNTVATTSFGGTQDAGTTITVRPQIAEGDHMLLEYSVSLSTFVGDSTDPSLPPPRQQNNITSVATIPDGYTVVVGGLETITEIEAVSQVPLFGDIPILGELFKNRSRTATRSHFYVFIRADVLRQAQFDDLKYISERDLAAADLDDGWPTVEPRLIR